MINVQRWTEWREFGADDCEAELIGTACLEFRELVYFMRKDFPFSSDPDFSTLHDGGGTDYETGDEVRECVALDPNSPDRVRKYWALAVRIACPRLI
jgi:hypothetical protein